MGIYMYNLLYSKKTITHNGFGHTSIEETRMYLAKPIRHDSQLLSIEKSLSEDETICKIINYTLLNKEVQNDRSTKRVGKELHR